MRRSALQALQILAEHQRSRLWASPASHAVLSFQLQDQTYHSHPCQWVVNWARHLQTITDINASREGSSTAAFDGSLKALHRNRVAYTARKQLDHSDSGSTQHETYVADPLLCGIADRLVDRLLDCKSRSFGNILIVGGAVVQVLERIMHMDIGVQQITVVDSSPDMLQYVEEFVATRRQSDTQGLSWPSVRCVTIDPNEELLQVEPGTFDLAVSCLGLHWFNDLPTLILATYARLVNSCSFSSSRVAATTDRTYPHLRSLHQHAVYWTMMAQCRFALKDDGLFLGALFAGDTLQELRISCTCAQQERHGGLSPIVSPFARARDGGNLLTRAGLALPAVDMDQFVVKYASGPTAVISHLRQLGEMNAVLQRQPILSRDTALAAGAMYQTMFGDADGSVPATFEVMFLTGWAPHASQQAPAKRGSATVSFQELAEGLVESGQAHGGSTGEADPEQCDVTLSSIQPNSDNSNNNNTKK